MAKGFTISRVGHVGIQVTNVDRSLNWYRDILGLTVTGRWPMGENGEMAFMRFTDDHHNIVLFTHPTKSPTRTGMLAITRSSTSRLR